MPTSLVIDDSETMREVASEILTTFGHEVLEAADAPRALVICEEGGVDVVLLDWDLPSLGALDFLRGIATVEPRPTIILCATENDARQFGLAKAAGAGFHVLKPYDRSSLTDTFTDAGFGPSRAVA